MLEIFAARRERLRAKLSEAGLSALLVSLAENRFYLSGFELHDVQADESAGCLLVCSNGQDCLFTDARYTEAAKALWDENHLEIYPNLSGAGAYISKYCAAAVSGRIGFEAKNTTVAFYNEFSPGLQLQAADGLVEALRVIKDKAEIELMEASARLNEQLMRWIPEQLVPGQTETDIAWSIEKFFREQGASELAFSPIVAIGPNGALPHAIPGAARLTDNCSILIDVGARLGDYNSDQTRTFWMGGAPIPQFTKTLEQVQTAQRLAIAEIRPGAAAADVYAKAAGFFEAQGVLAHFTHGLGHGVGLQTHEAPSLGSRSTVILQPGMIVTVEPGLYYPEWGGVRWEHMILVTEDGHRILGQI